MREQFKAAAEKAAPEPAPAKAAVRPSPPKPAPQHPAQRPPAPSMVPSEAVILKALTDDQKARHKAAWPALSAKNKADREAIYSAYGEQIKAASMQHKEIARPLWAQHFRQERTAAAAFTAREREAFGVIANALAAAQHQQATGQAPNRGLLSLTFANVLNADARQSAFTAQQETRRGEVARQLRQALDQDVSRLKDARAAALDRQREAFAIERAALIATQDAEKAKIREAWKQVYSRRGKEPEPRARQAVRPMESQPVKKEFDQARGVAPTNLSPHPTERRFVSTPAPSPSPAGAPPIPARAVQEVPKKPEPIMPAVTRSSTPPAKDWSKVAGPAQQPATPAPAKDWMKAATPEQTPAQPAPAKDWMKAATPAGPQAAPPSKDWLQERIAKIEIKPLPERGKDRDWER